MLKVPRNQWNGEYYDADGQELYPIYKEYFAVECRFSGSDGWQHICVTDHPDEEIEHQKTIEDYGDVEYRAELDHADIIGYSIGRPALQQRQEEENRREEARKRIQASKSVSAPDKSKTHDEEFER